MTTYRIAPGALARPRVASSDTLLERLKKLHPQSIDLSLGRIERLLAALGHPERKLPPVVHVAGTNGKGSFIAFIRAIAEALGKGVHVYTSPHLVHFHERIVLAGPHGSAPIAEDLLVDCLARAEAANDGELITLFEITTAAAFLAFAETPADLLLLETGLGGRLDATNVVAKPALTAITPISIDHVSFLGDTLTAIAGEKAGILKAGVPCVVGRQEQEALRRDRARGPSRSARRCMSPAATSTCTSSTAASSSRPRRRLHRPAAAAPQRAPSDRQCRHGDRRGEPAVRRRADHRARSSTASPMPNGRRGSSASRCGGLHAYVAEGTEIWLDGGHNAAGGKVIAHALAEFDERVPRPSISSSA